MTYGYGYGPGANGGWLLGTGLMMVFGLIAIVGVVVLIVWAVRGGGTHPHMGAGMHMGGPQPMPPAGAPRDPAIDAARERYAKGEVTKEQFDEIMKTLGG